MTFFEEQSSSAKKAFSDQPEVQFKLYRTKHLCKKKKFRQKNVFFQPDIFLVEETFQVLFFSKNVQTWSLEKKQENKTNNFLKMASRVIEWTDRHCKD